MNRARRAAARFPRAISAIRFVRSLLWRALPAKYRFISIYRNHRWGSADASLSGTGSNLEQTSRIREQLPELLSRLQITSLLDVPCGDFFWMKEVPLRGVRYLGADIVPQVIRHNQRRYSRPPATTFITLDMTRDVLPKADMIFCRDGLVHLSDREIIRALGNMRRSGSTYLLTTTFPRRGFNEDIPTGGWRALDLEQAPFGLPPPILTINENCPDPGYQDKSLCLWKTSDLPLPP